MIQAFQIIAERKIEEFFHGEDRPDLSHWRNKPLPAEDMTNVPADLRLAYRLLKNAGYLPEELVLCREIARVEDLLVRCRDEEEKYRQLKKLSVLQCKLESRLGRPARLDSDPAYFTSIVERVQVHTRSDRPQQP